MYMEQNNIISYTLYISLIKSKQFASRMCEDLQMVVACTMWRQKGLCAGRCTSNISISSCHCVLLSYLVSIWQSGQTLLS